jgi:hypothetical protein
MGRRLGLSFGTDFEIPAVRNVSVRTICERDGVFESWSIHAVDSYGVGPLLVRGVNRLSMNEQSVWQIACGCL